MFFGVLGLFHFYSPSDMTVTPAPQYSHTRQTGEWEAQTTAVAPEVICQAGEWENPPPTPTSLDRRLQLGYNSSHLHSEDRLPARTAFGRTGCLSEERQGGPRAVHPWCQEQKAEITLLGCTDQTLWWDNKVVNEGMDFGIFKIFKVLSHLSYSTVL